MAEKTKTPKETTKLQRIDNFFKIDNFLFKLEKVAILVLLIFPKFSWLSFFCSILTCFLCIEVTNQRRLGAASSAGYYYHMFWLERVASILLIVYNRDINYKTQLFIAVIVIQNTYNALILSSIRRPKFQKNAIPNPNPREITNKDEQSEREQAKIEDDPPKEKSEVHQEAPKEENNKWETNKGEKSEKVKAKIEDDPPKEEFEVIEQESPKEESQKWEEDLVEAEDQLKENSEVEEEDNKWDEDLVEALEQEVEKEETKEWMEDLMEEAFDQEEWGEDQLVRKALEEAVPNKWKEDLVKEALEQEAAKDENDKCEDLGLASVLNREHLLKTNPIPDFESLLPPPPLAFLKVDGNLEEVAEADEVDSVSGNAGGSEIENDVNATIAENVSNEEVVLVVEDHNEAEVEKLKTENYILKKEKEVLRETLRLERLVHEDARQAWKMHNQNLDARLFKETLDNAALASNLESAYKSEKDLLARLKAYEELCSKWEEEKKDICATIASVLQHYKANIAADDGQSNQSINQCNNWEAEKAILTAQLSAASYWYQYYYQVANSYTQYGLIWEQEKNNFSAEVFSAKQSSEYYRGCFRDCEKNCHRFMERNNELAEKLQSEANSASHYRSLVLEYEEKCRVLEDDKNNLTAKLCSASASSELYRSMLRDIGC